MPEEIEAGESSSASSNDQLEESAKKIGGRRASSSAGSFSFRQQPRKRRSSTRSISSNHESSHSSSELSIHAITKKLASEDADDEHGRLQRKIQKALKRENFTLNELNLDELELFGRDEEFAILVEAFETAAAPSSTSSSSSSSVSSKNGGSGSRSCRLVNVTGRAGTGKTRLCLELEAKVKARGGIFILGKFDARSQRDPYSGFAVALSKVPSLVYSLGDKESNKVCAEIREAVGEEYRLLTTLVPELARLFMTRDANRKDDKNQPTQIGSLEDKYETRSTRITFLVLEVIRSICTSGHPVVLFLDDIQWSDPSSLSLIADLVSGKDLSSFMLLTTCREEDMNRAHPVQKQMEVFHQYTSVRSIPLDSLDVSAVHSIVRTALRSSDDSTSQLSKIVYQKSNGNPMYVIQFLNNLYEDGILYYNLGLLRWTWDDSQVQSQFVTDNVVDLTTSKLKRFEPRVQTVLQLATCLGQTFDRLHLQALLEDPTIRSLFPFASFGSQNGSESGVKSDLDVLEREMVIESTSKLGRYNFVHDLIKEAAFQLIPETVRVTLQISVGRKLLECHQTAALDNVNYFRAVDMSNMGVSLLDDSEKLALAHCNLVAGEAAMSIAAFASALKFFEVGLSSLGPDGWANEPWLALDLTNGVVEACYCTADFATMETHISSILNREISIWDKIRAYKTRILAFVAEDRLVEAIDTGRQVLSDLGVTRLPRRPGFFHVLAEFAKTKYLMRLHTEQSLAALPDLDNLGLFHAANIVDVMQTAAFLSNPNLFIVMNLRILRWTVTHGVCQFSPTQFASYGMILCILGNTVAASSMGMSTVRFLCMHCMFDSNATSHVVSLFTGTIAMSLSERLDTRSSRSKTINFVYSSCVVWTIGLRSCLKPLLRGYRVGMQTGEVSRILS
jgi:predicted ATPase